MFLWRTIENYHLIITKDPPPILEGATARQNQQNDLCAQRRLKSGWASAPSDQSLRCPHEETLGLSYLMSGQRRL